MLLPISWLKDMIDLSGISYETIEQKLFSCGFEVEEKTKFSPWICGIVVGRIKSISKHKDYESLNVCLLDCGKHGANIQIVTGASNVSVGDLVPVALAGAKVYGNRNNKTVIKEAVVKGIQSSGMLCSGAEIGITDDWYNGADVNGILILDSSSRIGQDIREFLCLDEEIWDISITANMPHCQSVYGIARELGAYLDRKVVMPNLDYKTGPEKILGVSVSVLNMDICPRYIAHCVKNVKIEKSPVWMRRRLILCGGKPINNIVDITNYVLMEMGQPMHAFDLSRIDGPEIVVRLAHNGEKITILNGQSLKLTNENLLICDKNKPIALAGVMGGVESGIQKTTTDVIFESAKFSRGNIRKTSRSLGISSDSSLRFQKGVDEYTTSISIKRALHLVEKLDCGIITSTSFDVHESINKKNHPVKTTFGKINGVLGIKIPNDVAVRILKNMGYDVHATGEEITATAPIYREDVEDFPDLAEDIIKVYGYEHIQPSLLSNSTITVGGLTNAQKFGNQIKNCLLIQGCHELMNYSFYSTSDIEILELEDGDSQLDYISLMNPISEKYSIMRTVLAPSIIKTLSHNIKVGNCGGRFFELANVFKNNNENRFQESLHLGIGIYGDNESFFTLKGIVESIGNCFDIKFCYKKKKFSFLHPYISTEVFIDNQSVGFIGKVSYNCAKNAELLQDAFIGELNYDIIKNYFYKIKKYKPISVYPEISRDLALVVDKKFTCEQIEETIKQSCDMVSEIKLFDIYEGEQISPDKKSMTFTIKFRSEGKLLGATIVDTCIDQILSELNDHLGVNIRGTYELN